ncbi:MAG: TIGR00303 family protein [Synergistes sp.]|nr:TIGR00303 family protein [Synergistes sp.]
MFQLFIAETELAKIPGLSDAGANVALLPYTAPADADMLFFERPKASKSLPFDPSGHPSPAIITRASMLEAGFSKGVVCAGLTVEPVAPHTSLGSDTGHDTRFENAVPNYKTLAAKAKALAEQWNQDEKYAVLGESIVGGTTTAMLVLRALGCVGTVSSAGPVNPLTLKEEIWQKTSKRLGITCGGLKGCGLETASLLGDPMQIAVASYAAALPRDVKVVLAGGTQMMAVAAIMRDMGVTRDILVATTKYVHKDPTSCFEAYAHQIGVDWYAAPLDFSKSRFKGLSEYEIGFIKEGVGAGGAVWYAQHLGVSMERIQSRTEEIYEQLSNCKEQTK